MRRTTLASSFVAIMLLAGPSHAGEQLSPTESQILSALDSDRTIALTRRLSEELVKNDSGAGAGSAIAGSADERLLAGFIEAEMKQMGLEVRRESFPVHAYDYGKVVLRAAGKELPAITQHSGSGTWGAVERVPYTKGNTSGGRRLRTALLDAGEGWVHDYANLSEVRGKAVLVRRGDDWLNSQVVMEAAEQGASAILLYDYDSGAEAPQDSIQQMSIVYRDPIPTVTISNRDAAWLKERLAEGEVMIELENRVDVGYGFSENVIGMIRGTEYPDEWIVVSAHHDRWFQGAQDDSVGVAVMLELARVISEGYRPRRSFLFIAFGSEEVGGLWTQFDWLAGSYAFIRAHPEVTSRLAYAFNVDLAGWTGREGQVRATLDQVAFQRGLLADLGLDERVTVREHVGTGVDAWSLGGVRGGAVAYLSWTGDVPFSRYYHTQHDLYRAEDYANLQHDLRHGALGVLRMDQAVVLPVGFSEIVDWVTEQLDRIEQTVSSLSTPTELLFEARQSAERLRTQAERLAAASASVVDRDDIAVVNALLMKTRHDLVPWLLNTEERLRGSRYAEDFTALQRARLAATDGDTEAAAAALEEVNTMQWGKRVSPETYRAERLLSYEPTGWMWEFDQHPRPVDPELHTIYSQLRAGRGVDSVSGIARLEAQAEGSLRKALFIVAGKLREAARALADAPLPNVGSF